MPVLPNAKHERFAQEIAKGKSANEAYVIAGYVKNDGNAIRLKGDERILSRIDELLSKSAEKAMISIESVLSELGKVGFANMQDYMKSTDDGDPYLDFSNLTRDQAAALSEVTVESFKEGKGKSAKNVQRVKFKLGDKLSALDKIGRHLGMFKDRVELTGKDGAAIQVDAVDMSPLEVARRMAFMLEQGRRAMAAMPVIEGELALKDHSKP